MASLQITPQQILNSYRKSDAVLIVCQNNSTRTVEIAAINDEAARVLGFSNEELVGKPIELILTDRISSTINEFVEFEEGGNDLLAVLSKVTHFSVKTADGRELEFKLRIIRGDAIDRNPWYHLVLVDEEKIRKSNAFREVLKQNFKGHEVLDERTGLPDRASIVKDLELVVYHVRDKEISASFAVIDINRYEELLKQYGTEICVQIHRHIAHIFLQKLLKEDTVGTLSERSLGLIMVDAVQEPARMVLNRLRWAISAAPLELPGKKDLIAQVNISFSQIDGRIREKQILEKCEEFMVNQRNLINNNVQLVVTSERREGADNDRRKANIPVAVDRRKRDRRKS